MSIDLIKENGFILEKVWSSQYPAETITDTNYMDDLALLANTHAQTKFLLHCLEQASGRIDLHVNTNKTEFMGFKRRSHLLSKIRPLRLVYMFTYFSSHISSTESDVNIHLAKAWTAINRLLIIWQFDLSNKINSIFFNLWLCPYYCMDAPHGH